MTLEPTPLETAYDTMSAPEAGELERLRYFETLSNSELFLFLEKDPEDETVVPRLLETDEGTFLLAFDREDRLAEFAGGPAPYAAVSGRAIAAMGAPKDIGLGLNLGVARSEMLLPSDALAWLNDVLRTGAEQYTDAITRASAPAKTSAELLHSLEEKLKLCAGLAQDAHLVHATYATGRTGLALVFTQALVPARAAIAAAISEVVVFGGKDSPSIDVVFIDATSPVYQLVHDHGVELDIPSPANPDRPVRKAPGMDPMSPPILK